ncbi:MAG: hypothetical protein M3680_33890 [Myxococcota bacterium]|nr:hypothetical protein [Myxococcota bacterium]
MKRGAGLTGVLLVVALGCSKRQDEPAPVPPPRPPAIPAAELQRGQDACRAYVTKVCACAETVVPAKERCTLAQALPEAIEVATQVSMSPDSTKQDVLHATDSVRRSIAECIEQTSKLPELGCP